MSQPAKLTPMGSARLIFWWQMRLSNVVEKFKTKQTAEILALRKRVQTVCITACLLPLGRI